MLEILDRTGRFRLTNILAPGAMGTSRPVAPNATTEGQAENSGGGADPAGTRASPERDLAGEISGGRCGGPAVPDALMVVRWGAGEGRRYGFENRQRGFMWGQMWRSVV